MDVQFIKMQGAGNDYVYLDLVKHTYSFDFSRLARCISSRHYGVGGDGLVLIMPCSRADFKMRMFNADGSEAEMCGNAIRCVGKYLFDKGYLAKEQFSIETLAGVKDLWIQDKNPQGLASRVRVDMGEPVLNGKHIPVNIDASPVKGVDIMGYTGTAVSMGNPHLVIFLDRIEQRHVLEHGPRLETHPLFPNKTNVEFVRINDRQNITMRVWERGAGETMACGTGACAGVAAGVLNGLVDRQAAVNLPGGTLTIEWNEQNNRVYLTGPAEEVFKGVYFYHQSGQAHHLDASSVNPLFE
ncbi:MAG: diaminopimelate epimerase [Spirochaetota bacterium]